MIDKQAFYHGAAIIRLFEDLRCESVARHAIGYLVNESIFVFLKYSTKSRSPWRFSFSLDEIRRLSHMQPLHNTVVALVCGGDGICAITWTEAEASLGNNAGWISAKRNFNESYGVAGSVGSLKRKVPLQRWPLLVFEPSL